MPTLFIDTIFTCRATHLWIDQSGRWTWDSWRWRTSSSSSPPGGTPSARHPAPCAGNMSGINLGLNQIFTINRDYIFHRSFHKKFISLYSFYCHLCPSPSCPWWSCTWPALPGARAPARSCPGSPSSPPLPRCPHLQFYHQSDKKNWIAT